MNITAATSAALAPAPEDAATLAQKEQRRSKRLLLSALLLAPILGLAMTVRDLDSVLPAVVLLVVLAMPFLIWQFPRFVLFTTFGAVCLFELFQTPWSDALTDRIPFFWNVNTIFQVYAHINFKALPLSLCEVFLIAAGSLSLIRAVLLRQVVLRRGELLGPILFYMAFVLIGWMNGMASGGDFKISLQEVRAQFYFLIAYQMACQLVRGRRQADALLWTTVLCVGLKGFLYTFRRYVTLHGQPTPDQGVGSHEEAFLFDCFVGMLLTLFLCRTHPRARGVMFCLLPVVILGNIACNRRAGTAALAISIPIVLMVAYRSLPDRRRAIAAFATFIALTGTAYYFTFRNSNSAIAQPARAIKSQFEPDERDASSNAYRDAENQDQLATIRAHPLGYGYGKRMLHAVAIADISEEYEWWDILPHNQILWVWMRTGTLGFFAFWAMMSAIVIRLIRLARFLPSTEQTARAVTLFTLMAVTMLLVFGLLDLQLSNFRDMLFVGFWLGTCDGYVAATAATGGQSTPGSAGASAEIPPSEEIAAS